MPLRANRFAAAPIPAVRRFRPGRSRRAISRVAISAAAALAELAAPERIVTSAGAAIRAVFARRQRSTPAAARRHAISAIADRRA
jgi:hypothetical protein